MFHFVDLIVILVIGLLIAGPKALQSMSRSAGKGMGQAKAVKDKVLSEVPMEEISELSQKIPLNPQQAVQMLLTPEQEENKEKEERKESSSPSSTE